MVDVRITTHFENLATPDFQLEASGILAAIKEDIQYQLDCINMRATFICILRYEFFEVN